MLELQLHADTVGIVDEQRHAIAPLDRAADDGDPGLPQAGDHVVDRGGVDRQTEVVHADGVLRAGLGVGLMATLGPCPEVLVPCSGLPAARPLPLSLSPRRGLPPQLAKATAASLTRLLATTSTPLLGAA